MPLDSGIYTTEARFDADGPLVASLTTNGKDEACHAAAGFENVHRQAMRKVKQSVDHIRANMELTTDQDTALDEVLAITTPEVLATSDAGPPETVELTDEGRACLRAMNKEVQYLQSLADAEVAITNQARRNSYYPSEL